MSTEPFKVDFSSLPCDYDKTRIVATPSRRTYRIAHYVADNDIALDMPDLTDASPANSVPREASYFIPANTKFVVLFDTAKGGRPLLGLNPEYGFINEALKGSGVDVSLQPLMRLTLRQPERRRGMVARLAPQEGARLALA